MWILVIIIGILSLLVAAQQVIAYVQKRRAQRMTDQAIAATATLYREMAEEEKKYVEDITVEPDGIDATYGLLREKLRKHRAIRMDKKTEED